tara:strand:- start:258 stop:1154 length:897 start_codon:yes stop_codon:yes gene_type:complete
MTVYSCGSFFNENDLLELKLKEQWDFVDKFIILEVGETHTGNKKPYNFDRKRFDKYKSKLTYKTFDNFDNEIFKHSNLLDSFSIMDKTIERRNTKDWIRERFQGNYQKKILIDEGAKDNDLIIISALDEIVSKDAFERAIQRFENTSDVFSLGGPVTPNLTTTRPVFGFKLDLYVYKLNLFCKNEATSMMTEFNVLKKILPTTIQGLSLSTHTPIENGGWHFAWLDKTGGREVLAKQQSWAHARDILPNQKIKYTHTTTEEALERLFLDFPIKKVEISTTTHPASLINNIKDYEGYID